MAKTDFKSVDEYIATQPEDVQATLRRVRNTLRKAMPGAEESISYQIPTYKPHGAPVLYFAGWKQHYSLYPATEQVFRKLHDAVPDEQLKQQALALLDTEEDPKYRKKYSGRWKDLVAQKRGEKA